MFDGAQQPHHQPTNVRSNTKIGKIQRALSVLQLLGGVTIALFLAGELLKAAEEAGFDVLVTADKKIRYQRNLSVRTIALVVLGHPQWPILRLHVDGVVAAVNAASPGSYTEVDIPRLSS